MKRFAELPKEVQDEIKDWLKVYDLVSVTYENGACRYGFLCLKKTYAEDYKFVGEYTSKEVFTEDERVVNYVENFHAYPTSYKGKRNYKWLKSLTWNDKIRFDENGNLVSDSDS